MAKLQNRFSLVAWGLLLAAGAAVFWQDLSTLSRGVGSMDIPIFIETARQFLAGSPVYSPDMSAYAPAAPVYKFPPLSLLFLVGLLKAGLSDAQIVQAGMATQLLFWWASLVLLVMVGRQLFARQALPALAAVWVFLCFSPFFETFLVLQLETWLLLLFSMAALLLGRGHHRMAGFLTGLAIAIKIYPVLFLWLFVMYRNGKALLGAGVAIVLATLVTLAVFGVEDHWRYIHDILPRMLAEQPIGVWNVSVSRLFLELTGNPATASLFHKAVFGVILLGYSAWVYLGVRAAPVASTLPVFDFAVFVALAVMGLGNSWLNYQLLLFLPVVICLFVLARFGKHGLLLVLAALAALVQFLSWDVMANSWIPLVARYSPQSWLVTDGDLHQRFFYWSCMTRAGLSLGLLAMLFYCRGLLVRESVGS